MVQESYMYTVKPVRPIKNLNNDIKIIRTNKSLYLTLEEVKKCLPLAMVYRRFSADNNVRCTIDNIERLHNETLLTEAEWKAKQASNLGEARGTAPAPEEKKPEPEIKEETKPAESKAEEQEVGENTEPEQQDSTPVENNEEAPSSDQELKEEEVAADESSVEEPVVEEKQEDKVEEVHDTSDKASSSEEEAVEANDASVDSNITVNTQNGGKKKHKH